MIARRMGGRENKGAHERMSVREGAQVSEPEFYSCSGVGKGLI